MDPQAVVGTGRLTESEGGVDCLATTCEGRKRAIFSPSHHNYVGEEQDINSHSGIYLISRRCIS